MYIAERRPGFYCRVLTEGTVEAGDPIEQIAEGQNDVTMLEIFLAYHGSKKAVEFPLPVLQFLFERPCAVDHETENRRYVFNQ